MNEAQSATVRLSIGAPEVVWQSHTKIISKLAKVDAHVDLTHPTEPK